MPEEAIWKISLRTAATPEHDVLVSDGDDALTVLVEWLDGLQAARDEEGFAEVAFNPPLTITVEEAR